MSTPATRSREAQDFAMLHVHRPQPQDFAAADPCPSSHAVRRQGSDEQESMRLHHDLDRLVILELDVDPAPPVGTQPVTARQQHFEQTPIRVVG
jgi:hypothetical protein